MLSFILKHFTEFYGRENCIKSFEFYEQMHLNSHREGQTSTFPESYDIPKLKSDILTYIFYPITLGMRYV